MERVTARMTDLGVDCLLLSVGADLPWLTGYEAMPLERLTMLVVPRGERPTLVVPRLEEPRVVHRGEFDVRAWDEDEDAVDLVASLAGAARTVAVGDRTWATFLLALQERMPDRAWRSAREIVAPLRAVKDSEELATLAGAAEAVDSIAAALRDATFGGRREVELAREVGDRLLDAGHTRVDFVIVGSGPNGASPHHEPGDRVIGEGDVVVCDFGGSWQGYSSDVTRTYTVGEPSSEVVETYAALVEAQEAAVRAATAGTPAEAVDRVARDVLARAGMGERFIHRTGHGIGVETHEEPYLAPGNTEPLATGNVFSVEPGIYVPGRFGMRLEDIVAVTEDGPRRLNHAPRDLAVVG